MKHLLSELTLHIERIHDEFIRVCGPIKFGVPFWGDPSAPSFSYHRASHTWYSLKLGARHLFGGRALKSIYKVVSVEMKKPREVFLAESLLRV